MIEEPRGVAGRWPTPRVRALATLSLAVSATPWALPAVELSAAERAHAIALAIYFNHLNRIADAVAVPLDYAVALEPPHADPAIPALGPAPSVRPAPPVLTPHLAAWSEYVFDRDAPLSRPQRALIARHVGRLLGHAVDGPDPASALDHAVLVLAEQVTLAPWQLADASYGILRADGLDDEALFDIVVTASTAGAVSRAALAA